MRPGAVAAIVPFREGWFFVQDETAMRIARLLDPGPGEAVLDLSAGAGGKVTHIEALRGAGGTVVALDVDAVRLQRLVENVRRLGSVTIRPVRADARRAPWAGGRFDAVLADVPCSNTGVLARRPEARWRLRPADIRTLADLQQALLEAAWQQVRPGGRVAYATCSIEREENERVIEKFVRRHAEARLLRTELRLPEPGRGGGFFALLRKPQ
jgi:16S rRNA (cytosine967-C5)-methyltransferase